VTIIYVKYVEKNVNSIRNGPNYKVDQNKKSVNYFLYNKSTNALCWYCM